MIILSDISIETMDAEKGDESENGTLYIGAAKGLYARRYGLYADIQSKALE